MAANGNAPNPSGSGGNAGSNPANPAGNAPTNPADADLSVSSSSTDLSADNNEAVVNVTHLMNYVQEMQNAGEELLKAATEAGALGQRFKDECNRRASILRPSGLRHSLAAGYPEVCRSIPASPEVC